MTLLSQKNDTDFQRLKDETHQTDHQEVQILPVGGTPKNHHLGKTLVCCWVQKKPLCSLGPDWFLFFLSFLVVEGVGIGIYIELAKSQEKIIKTILLVMIILEGFAFGFTAIKNPGIASISKRSQEKDLKELSRYANFCRRCQILRDETTYHCDICDVCIQGYDHHCPWTGKCIGVGNVKAFYTFITTTLIYFVFCMIITFKDLLQ